MAPFFVAQEEAKGGLGLGLNNNLHTNTVTPNEDWNTWLHLKHYA